MRLTDYIAAARVPRALEPQEFGEWFIQRRPSYIDAREGAQNDWTIEQHALNALNAAHVGFPDYTLLWRYVPMTLANMHQEHPADIVMEDSARELRRHLPIWRAAYGRILITGLGLGCVVRGLLAKPQVEHIDVVEIDPDIFRIIGAEFIANPRVTLHLDDALTWRLPSEAQWDFAWHDLYCTPNDDGYSKLQYLHFNLIFRFKRHVGQQGAWMLPRWIPRVTRMPLLGSKRRAA